VVEAVVAHPVEIVHEGRTDARGLTQIPPGGGRSPREGRDLVDHATCSLIRTDVVCRLTAPDGFFRMSLGVTQIRHLIVGDLPRVGVAFDDDAHVDGEGGSVGKGEVDGEVGED
jgi:hypothetical protein